MIKVADATPLKYHKSPQYRRRIALLQDLDDIELVEYTPKGV